MHFHLTTFQYEWHQKFRVDHVLNYHHLCYLLEVEIFWQKIKKIRLTP